MEMSIQAELADVMSKVNAWSLAKETELQAVKAEHTSFLDTHNDMTQQLKQREKTAKIQFEKLSTEVNKRQQILDDLQQENQDLHKLSEQLPQELAVLEGKVAEEQEKAKLQHQALEQSDALRNDNRSVLELGHELYQKRLGLKFERFSDGSLVIKMDNVDPADHARVFFFSVRLSDADDQWTVRECVPMVDGLQALVDELNTTNSLSLLVRAVRQQWRRQVGA